MALDDVDISLKAILLRIKKSSRMLQNIQTFATIKNEI